MPQPVDLQTEIGRITAAERIQAISDRASLASQQRVATEEQATRIDNETVVHQTQPKEPEVNEEIRRRMGRRHESSRRGKSDGREGSPDELEDDLDGDDPNEHAFDVTV